MDLPSRLPAPTHRLRHTGRRKHRSSTFMRKRAERINSAPPQASLLGIPGELRNRISRMILVEDKPIEITATDNHEQPGLLRTCRQLRAETRSIFEKENDFALEVIDVRPSIPAKYGFHWSGPLITHGYFTNTLTECRYSKSFRSCLFECKCIGHEAADEWEERGRQEGFGSKEIGENVGWCFHASMESALRNSAEGAHPRTRMNLCPSAPAASRAQLQNWLEIVTTMPSLVGVISDRDSF